MPLSASLGRADQDREIVSGVVAVVTTFSGGRLGTANKNRIVLVNKCDIIYHAITKYVCALLYLTDKIES